MAPKKTKPQPAAAPAQQRGKHGLTDMQKAFCEHLATGCNQTEAMRRAGSAGTDAGMATQAARWLKLPKVQTYLASLPLKQAQAAASAARIATAQERQEWWTRIMYGEIETEAYDMEGNRYMRRPSLKERLQAAETLGKAQGDFKDDESRKAAPNIVINLPKGPMTPEQIAEARTRIHGGTGDGPSADD